MAMVGSKEIMSYSLSIEKQGADMVPHPLAKASLEVVRTTIAPDFNGVHLLDEIELHELLPDSMNEEIIILVYLLDVAHEIMVLTTTFTVFSHKLKDQYAILNGSGVSVTVSNVRIGIYIAEVHQCQQVPTLEISSA